MVNDSSTGADAVIRSLITAQAYKEYEVTGKYNLGGGLLNRMIIELANMGYLTDQNHKRLKKRLASCELNVHLDDIPGAKRYGPFVVVQGGL